MIFKTKIYYSFDEVCSKLANEEWEHIPFVNFPSWLSIVALYPSANLTEGVSLKPHLSDLLNLVFTRFQNHYIGYTENETLSNNDALKMFYKVITIIKMTYERYSTILNAYSNGLNKLMDPIRNTSRSDSRFNDTPQNGGDYSDDAHTTSITQIEGETTTEGATKMARINEIQESIKDTLLLWSNEFDKIFIEEENVHE